MGSFNLKILTLDGIIFDGEVESIVARTSVGDVCILKNHIDNQRYIMLKSEKRRNAV